MGFAEGDTFSDEVVCEIWAGSVSDNERSVEQGIAYRLLAYQASKLRASCRD